MADPQEEQQRQETLVSQAGQVISLLSQPRAFLLFLFAVLALFEWSNYHKTERMVQVVQDIINGMETNRTREMAGQQQLVSDLIDILEYRNTGVPRPQEPPNASQGTPSPLIGK